MKINCPGKGLAITKPGQRMSGSIQLWDGCSVRADQPFLFIGHDLLFRVSDCPVLALAQVKPWDTGPACDTVHTGP